MEEETKLLDLDGLAYYHEQLQDEIDDLLADKQDTLVSGTSIKTINNESLLGSGNITIQGGGGDTTYEINVTSYPDFSTTEFNGLDTTANRTVYKAIYDNFSSIDAKNVFIISDDVFSDGIKKINVKEIELKTSGSYKYLYIYTNWYSIGQNTYYGVEYQHLKQHCISIKFSNDEVNAINDYVTIRDTFPGQTSSGAGVVLGLTNTTAYTPTGNYNPATKKYVDDAVAGGGGGSTDVQINGTSIVSSDVANIATEGTYNSSTNKIATMSDVNALITASTTDISEGDPLASGTLYIVYE